MNSKKKQIKNKSTKKPKKTKPKQPKIVRKTNLPRN